MASDLQKQKIKEERRQKKAAKREARVNVTGERRILCPPDAAGRKPALRMAGYVARLLVIGCAVAGLCSLFISAFLPEEYFGFAILFSFLGTLLAGLCVLHPVSCILGGAGSVVLLLAGTDVGLALKNGWSSVLTELHSRGFYAFTNYEIELTEAESGGKYLLAFTGILCLVLSWLFAATLAKRARILVPAIVSTLFLVFVFTYNIGVDNVAMLFLISGFTGVLILRAYDGLYRPAKKGGYAESDLLFESDRPAAQEEDEEAEKAKRAAEKERRREENAHIKTVDEELTDYFSAGKKKKTKKPGENKPAEDSVLSRAKEDAARYDRGTESARRGIGGLCALAATLLAFIILAIPVAKVSGSFNTIDSLDAKMDALREYVTAKLKGDDPIVDLYQYLAEQNETTKRSTTATTQTFNYQSFLTVRTQAATSLYLTSWIGADYADGSWQNFTGERYDAYRALYDLDAFPAENQFITFLETMYPELCEDTDFITKYRSNMNYGFQRYMVNFSRTSGFSRDVLLPRVWENGKGILEYRSTEKSSLTFANVFDGVCTGHLFDEEDTEYSVLAYVPTQRADYWMENMSRMIASYQAARRVIADYDSSKNKAAFVPDYSGIDETYTNLAQKYFDGTPAEQRAIKALFNTFDTYADFVYETYLGTADSEIITAVAAEIRENAIDIDGNPADVSRADWSSQTDPEVYLQRHYLVMSVIDYLVRNETYTLEITKESDPALDGVENFLTVTHEGYCVQFASSAALLLRELEIPVRYMEGYLVNDFYTSIYGSSDEENRYTSYVRDSNKHAWIEVWYDGIGWIVYETTPAYYLDMYGNYTATSEYILGTGGGSGQNDPTPTPEPTEPVTPEPTEEPSPTPTEPEETIPEWVAAVIRIVLIALAVLALLTLLLVGLLRFLRRANRAEEERAALAARILDAGDDWLTDEQERRAAASALVRNVAMLLRLYGSAPNSGEQKDAYAERLSFDYADVFGYPAEYETDGTLLREKISPFCIGDLLNATQAEEFGYGMTVENMRALAEFWRALRAAADKRLTRRQIRRLHYFKRLL